jgi:dihydrodipicolinate reductase
MSGNSKNTNTGQELTFPNSAEEYRRYLIRVMRTRAGDISRHDEVCQSRKQITGDVRHGSIKRDTSAVGEGSIAIELVHQYLDRF